MWQGFSRISSSATAEASTVRSRPYACARRVGRAPPIVVCHARTLCGVISASARDPKAGIR
jgi:hypothetical protein